METVDDLAIGVAMSLAVPKASALRAALLDGTLDAGSVVSGLSEDEVAAHQTQTADLRRRDVNAIWLGHPRYPQAIAQMKAAPPVIFSWGNLDLLSEPSVGMCGSRNVSPMGLSAARACGEAVASHGLAIVSGYAKGVDTETHLAALASGGATVIVLAEGIRHFRVKNVFKDTTAGLDPERVLVLSQFPPSLRWNVGAAMTRNLIIAGLGRALVVVEAGETGGTLNAGLQALDAKRPVIALQFETQDTPPGNRLLLERGAIPVSTPGELNRVLDNLSRVPMDEPVSTVQLTLL